MTEALADVAHSFTMESGPRVRRCRHSHSTGLLYPSWRRRTNYLQGALMFIMFTVQFQWGLSKRNETLVFDTALGAWNKTRYKTEGRCLQFHSNATPSYFYYWPEDDPGFDHCCSEENQVDNFTVFTSFTHVKYGPQLQHATYHDLGLIDQCLPYWRCWHLFDRLYEIGLFTVECEVTDLRRLYERRFFIDTICKRGLLQSALPLILISEILVILSIGLYRFMWQRRPRVNESRGVRIQASKSWLRNVRKTVLVDWTHLCLLAIIGSGLIDAVARQVPYLPQAKSFYNYGILYVFLSILVACSSVLHQMTFWIAEMDEAVTCANYLSPRHASKPAELEKTIGLSDDWKWQPLAAQLAILFSLGTFLVYPGDSPAAAVIGIVVAAACPWSGLYASKVIVRTVLWLLMRVYQNPFGRRRN